MVPKAEIHCHIEGAASPALVQTQAQIYGVDVSGIVQDGRFVWDDFTGFLQCYDRAAALFRTAEDYALLAETYLTELAQSGCIYSEIFISTDHARMIGLSERDYIDGLAQGMTEAKRKTGIEARMIATGLRHEGPASVLRAATHIAENPHPLVTGFGMGGDERLYHPKDLAPGFDVAREAGLGITTHAGEFAGPESVRASLTHLKPSRIGHGVRSIEDPELVQELAEKQIVLECCPGSNIALSVYDSFEQHPFLALRAAGVPVTLNSDDPPHFHTSLEREYDIGAQDFGLSDAELRDITRTAIEAAFVDETTRAQLLRRLG
ncbi:adenosine deaminase [Roseobacter sinensis]|uniref:Adenine deaminase n=1 Tax=Roseobacter sinensis TaxID=2931391 RepID=A0ABT3B995_9RHOB|nr:adenosine deaminase [Roseobacter sp. WL0113]MCV3270136.1 adenosine deaminase [Roseobacter sp. WL0113]